MENKKKITISQSAASVITAFAGVIILMIVFSCMNPNFIKPDSIMTLLRSIVPYLLVGIGQAYVCITGNIDLSIGSVLGMSAMISATMMCNGSHPIVAILVSFIACMAIGFINGVLVGKFKLPPFIGTLGTMTIGRGIAQLANNNYNTDNIGSEGAALNANDTPSTAVFYGAEGTMSESCYKVMWDRYTNAFVSEMQAFAEAVSKDLETPVTGMDGLYPVLMAAAAVKSLKEHRPVAISEVE